MDPDKERSLALGFARAVTAITDPPVSVEDEVRLSRRFNGTWKNAQAVVAAMTGLTPRARTAVFQSRHLMLVTLVDEQLEEARRKEIESPPAGMFLPLIDPASLALEAGRDAALLSDDGYVDRREDKVIFVMEKLARVARENGEELGAGPAQFNYAVGVAADAAILDGFPFLDEIPVIANRQESHPLKARDGLAQDATRFPARLSHDDSALGQFAGGGR